jgi:hypothetical protein
MDITEIGVRILFFPLALVLGIIILGITLFTLVNIVYLIVKIPVAIFNRSLKATEESEEEKIQKKIKSPKKKLTFKELWFQFEKGDWIIWIAAIPVVLIIFSVLLQLFFIISNR